MIRGCEQVGFAKQLQAHRAILCGTITSEIRSVPRMQTLVQEGHSERVPQHSQPLSRCHVVSTAREDHNASSDLSRTHLLLPKTRFCASTAKIRMLRPCTKHAR